MAYEHRTVAVGGRSLAVHEFGDPAGQSVVALHGAGVSGRFFALYHEDARAARVRLLAPDRSGYGSSTYAEHTTAAEAAGEIRAVVDEYELSAFGILGIGTASATAIALARASASESVRALVLVSPRLPITEPKVGQHLPRARGLLARKVASVTSMTNWAARASKKFGARRRLDGDSKFARSLPAGDRRALMDPSVCDVLAAELKRGSVSAARAATRDERIVTSDWGVPWAELPPGIEVWHGKEDAEIPLPAVRQFVFLLPEGRLRVFDDSGRFLAADRDQIAALVHAAAGKKASRPLRARPSRPMDR